MIEIKAGLDLDRAIAGVIGLICTHRVLGSDIEFYVDPRAGANEVPRMFKPSTDLNDAFQAAEVAGLFDVVRNGPEVHLAKTIDGEWEILTGGSEMGYVTRKDTPALAICGAILKLSKGTWNDE